MFSRMSLGYVIFMAFSFVLYVAGMTQTVESYDYVEQTAYSLADMAHIRRFHSRIHSGNPQWVREGMRVFAFRHTSYYWKKRDLTWALMNDPVVMTRGEVISAMENACSKWGAVSPFNFKQVSSSDKPDIRVKSFPIGEYWYAMCTDRTENEYEMDRGGVTLLYAQTKEWTDRNHRDWCNFRFKVLLHMGSILGLDASNVPGAVMYTSTMNRVHPGAQSPDDYDLTKDDKDGIQAKYGPPTSSRWTTGTYGGGPPTGMYGGRQPTRPYGGGTSTGTYSGRPPTGTYGGRQPSSSSSSDSSAPASSSSSESASDSSDSSASSSPSTSSSS